MFECEEIQQQRSKIYQLVKQCPRNIEEKLAQTVNPICFDDKMDVYWEKMNETASFQEFEFLPQIQFNESWETDRRVSEICDLLKHSDEDMIDTESKEARMTDLKKAKKALREKPAFHAVSWKKQHDRTLTQWLKLM